MPLLQEFGAGSPCRSPSRPLWWTRSPSPPGDGPAFAGAPGAVIAGIAAFREPVTAARLIFVGLLPAGIIGLSLTAQKNSGVTHVTPLFFYALGRLQRNAAAQMRSASVTPQPVIMAAPAPRGHSSRHTAAPASDAQAYTRLVKI